MIRKDLVLQCVATHGLEIRTTNLLAFPELSSGRQCEKEGFGRATKGIAFEVLKFFFATIWGFGDSGRTHPVRICRAKES
jgi:hypothetical protein